MVCMSAKSEIIHSAHLCTVYDTHTACTSAHMSSLSSSSTLAGVLGLLLLEVTEGEMLLFHHDIYILIHDSVSFHCAETSTTLYK